ncbi:PKD domain-containing protein [Echinicola sp. CAU 1574]|uniref:PKD domain-containing protein n=1 Tax=Echinicola arenosa TaxID=2774144 RepID=A0ABR9AGW1_9BACT|nr:PKD domain-containing protein [Echinicola arenosa]MBD8487960.1 PKD domain-containing protein [Echinicola arenosa]
MNHRLPFFFIVFLMLIMGAVLALANNFSFTDLLQPSRLSDDLRLVPIADFEFDTSITCSYTDINFTNLSTGDSLTFEWNFGDENSGNNNLSTEEHPFHSFIGDPGTSTQTFTVSLTATEPDGSQSTITKDITLNQAPSLAVGSEQNGVDFDDLQYIIICENNDSEFIFYNQSTTQDTNVSYELDWGDGSEKFTGSAWSELSHAYPIGIYRITYSVTGSNGCTATEEYGIFVGSNPAVGLGNPGNTNVCGGQTLSFPITGTENNPEGTVYTVDYSDGSPIETYNHPPPAEVTHTFEESSCGVNSGDFPNSYSVKITASNPCSASSAVVSPIYVSEAPDPEFSAPEEPVCVESPVRIQNLTEFGGEVSNNGQCEDFGKFVWQITPETGWELSSGNLGNQPNPNAPNSWMNGSELIYPIFSEPGTYTVKLITGNRCGINEEVKTICVTAIPNITFEADILEGCGPLTVNTTNNSIVDESCGDSTVYNWTVRYQRDFCGTSADWAFGEGSGANSLSPTFNFIGPGKYTITLSTTTSCGTFTDEKEISVYAPPIVNIASIANICEPSQFNPQASIDLCDPSEPTYLWTFIGGTPASSTLRDPGLITFDTPGEKSVILAVTSGCGVVRDTVNFAYNAPPIAEAGQDSTICNGETITLMGAALDSGNYSYRWFSSGNDLISPPNIANPSVSPSANSTYTLIITDNETGCSAEDTVNINVEPAPIIEFSLGDQIICSGGISEAVTLTSSPGTTLEWSADYGPITGGATSGSTEIPSQTLINPTRSPVEVTYTAIIIATEQGSCNVQPAVYTITVNPSLEYSNDTISVCNGEPFNFVPEEQISGTTYTWTALGGDNISGSSNQSNPSPTIEQTLINSGNTSESVNYLIIPELDGCTGPSFQLTVEVIPSAVINFDSSPTQVICSGEQTQAINISSNIDDATFTWTAEANGLDGLVLSGESNTIPAQQIINPTGIPVEIIYTVSSSAESQGNCSGNTSSYSITVNPPITVTEQISDFSGYPISCVGAADGAIQINPSGGNGTYTFDWTGPNGFTSSDAVIDGLVAGTYNLTIRDGSSCAMTIEYILEEPSGVNISLSEAIQILCAGEASGAINIDISGGNTNIPYTYEWEKDGQLFGAATQNLSNIPAGEYFLTVFNGSNCPASLGPISITEPAATLEIDYTKEDISCYGANDGSLALNIQGGVAPYQLSWNFGSDELAFENLGPGTYTATVTDQVGCTKIEEITILDADIFQINPEVQSISCFGQQDGSISLNLEQDGQRYTIRWDHGSELENLFNLASGSYGVTLELDDGCQIRQEFNILEPAPLIMESQVIDATDCDNPQSGSISIGISGGTPPYSFSWDHGSTDQEILNIPAGQYLATVIDAAGCTYVQQFEVKRPPAISVIDRRVVEISCEQSQVTEEIELFVTGGIPPYSINWSAGEVSNNGLLMRTDQSGLFSVEIVDGNGCFYTESFTIENPPTVVDAEANSDSFAEFNSHLVNFDVSFQNLSSGNIASVFWDFGDGSSSAEQNPIHQYSSPGTYTTTLNIIDVYGCTSTKQLTLEVSDHFIAVPNVFTPNSDGINDQFFPKFTLVKSLEFWIYNKWGEIIFFTDDLNSEGWDGTINGVPAQPGNYVYKLNYSTMDNRQKSVTDVFLLLK